MSCINDTLHIQVTFFFNNVFFFNFFCASNCKSYNNCDIVGQLFQLIFTSVRFGVDIPKHIGKYLFYMMDKTRYSSMQTFAENNIFKVFQSFRADF